MTITRPARPSAPRAASPTRNRLAVACLLVLAAVPVAAGAFRLTDLGELTTANARFVTAPVPIVTHVVAATLYAVLGAFQFSSGIRRHRNGWHRAAGVVLVPAGALVAASGIWMTATYDLPAHDDGALSLLRYAVGTAMLAELALAMMALVRHDYPLHGAWMTRAYALGMGAGTQLFTAGPLMALDDPPAWARAAAMGLGWAINATVAEVVIRHRRRAR